MVNLVHFIPLFINLGERAQTELGISQIPIPTNPIWRKNHTPNRTSESYIASALIEGTEIAVSSGSYKENLGTSVLIIE